MGKLNIGVTVSGLCVAASLVLVACGSGQEGESQRAGTEKRLAGEGPCEFVSVDQLGAAAGQGFDEGEPDGHQCFYSATDSPATLIAIGAGVPGAGYLNQEPPGGATAEPEEIEIEGVWSRQLRAGDMCVVDVWLDPDAQDQVFSVSLTDIAQPGQDNCEVARDVASAVLNTLGG